MGTPHQAEGSHADAVLELVAGALQRPLVDVWLESGPLFPFAGFGKVPILLVFFWLFKHILILFII